MSRKKILWLCSWYPGKTEPFNGDFIQRHARAAALYNDLYIIHVYGDTSGQISKVEKEVHKAEGLTEHLVYFPKKTSFFGRAKAHYRWLFLFRQAIRKYMVENGKPDLVHIHIPFKAGLLGLWLKKRYKLPFLVSEHWGIYNDVEVLNYSGRSSSFKRFTKNVFEQAAACISVSRYLAAGVSQLVLSRPFAIIPNVVDTTLFFPAGKPASPLRFIHVSNMVPLKNTEGILRAFKQFKEQGGRAELWMIGDTDQRIRDYATSIGLQGNGVTFFGEVSYAAVAEKMKQCHCLMVNSNIENSPCVIGEALCTGLPVIATEVGGIPELVNEKNALLIRPGDDEGLCTAMRTMMESYSQFDLKKIADDARGKFSYPAVGKLFDEAYKAVLSP